MIKSRYTWIRALQSGTYIQGYGYINKAGALDPFGVACHLFKLRGRKIKDGIVLYDNHAFDPPARLLEILELERNPNIQMDIVSQVHRWNDVCKYDFNRISHNLIHWFNEPG